MFDFQKLIVYQKAKAFNSAFFSFLQLNKTLPTIYKDQLRRASFSVMLNIAEGSSRFSAPDKKNFYVVARGSAFECVAILDFMLEENLISQEFHDQQFQNAEEISKMLMSLIKQLTK